MVSNAGDFSRLLDHVNWLNKYSQESPEQEEEVIEALGQLRAKIDTRRVYEKTRTLSPLESLPIHVLQEIVNHATVGTVAKLLQTSKTLNEKISKTTKWMPSLIRKRMRFFPNIVKYHHFELVYSVFGTMCFRHPGAYFDHIPLEAVLKSPFRFSTLQLNIVYGYRRWQGVHQFGVQREITETATFDQEFEYKTGHLNQFILLQNDIRLLRKITKQFAVRITCISEQMMPIYEKVIDLLKPGEVSLLYAMEHVTLTETTLPSLKNVPLIRLEEQQFLFFDYLLAIPKVEGGCLKKVNLQTILRKWAAGKADFKLKKHVYTAKKAITPQFLTECFKLYGGGLKTGEQLPSWSCDKGRRRLLLTKKNRDIVITAVYL